MLAFVPHFSREHDNEPTTPRQRSDCLIVPLHDFKHDQVELDDAKNKQILYANDANNIALPTFR